MQLSQADEAAAVVDGLRRLVNGLRVSAHAAERELGLSGAQLFVLRELAAEPGCSIRRLSERTLTDPSSVSVVVARLVARKLVSRRRDPEDARRSALAVSSRGLAVLRRAPEPYQLRLIAALHALPLTRLRQFRVVLVTIVRELGLTRGAAPLFFEERPRPAPTRTRNANR
jgi:DNA-binding MarR family transcriptional regulator